MAIYGKNIQNHILIYVQSSREINFQLHILVLLALMKWYYQVDHYSYSLRLTAHLFHLVNLE